MACETSCLHQCLQSILGISMLNGKTIVIIIPYSPLQIIISYMHYMCALLTSTSSKSKHHVPMCISLGTGTTNAGSIRTDKIILHSNLLNLGYLAWLFVECKFTSRTTNSKQTKKRRQDTSNYSKPQEKAGKVQTKQTQPTPQGTMMWVWLSL